MSLEKQLIKSLVELRCELQNINPVCYSCKQFNQQALYY